MYQVKFQPPGKPVHYGVVENYSEEAEEAKLANEAIIEDAILPKRYRVPLNELTEIETKIGKWDPKTQNWADCDEFQTYVQKEFEKAQTKSDDLPDGLRVGKMFTVGVGDGNAFYIVTKINKKTCRVEWRGFSPDRWVDQILGWGGTFPIDTITPLCGLADWKKQLK